MNNQKIDKWKKIKEDISKKEIEDSITLKMMKLPNVLTHYRFHPIWNFGFDRKCPKCGERLQKRVVYADFPCLFVCKNEKCDYIYESY